MHKESHLLKVKNKPMQPEFCLLKVNKNDGRMRLQLLKVMNKDTVASVAFC